MVETNPSVEGAAPGDSSDLAPSPEPVDEAEKWKRLSRENEKRWKQASRELDQLREAQMTEHEKALEQARQEARSTALAEFGTSLAEAEIRAQAATAGVTIPTDYLDLSRFLGDDGQVDRERVVRFISSLPQLPTSPEPDVPHLLGAGHHPPGGNVISSMDPNELADLIAGASFI